MTNQTSTINEIKVNSPELLVAMAEQGITVWRAVDGEVIVCYNGMYTLTDNGGEINVDKINVWQSCVSIPTYWFNEPLSAITIVYRLLATMKGEEIDWQFRIS